jgi:hypothetical protein
MSKQKHVLTNELMELLQSGEDTIYVDAFTHMKENGVVVLVTINDAIYIVLYNYPNIDYVSVMKNGNENRELLCSDESILTELLSLLEEQIDHPLMSF